MTRTMDREIRIVHRKGTGDLQIFVDGVSEEEAVAIDLVFKRCLEQGMGIALAAKSAVEFHRTGGMQHAHVVGDVKHGHRH